MSFVQIMYTKIQVQANITTLDVTTPEFLFSQEKCLFIREKFVLANDKGKHSLKVKTLKRKRSYWSSEIRMRMWESFRGQTNHGLWIGFRSRLEFNSRHSRPRGMNKIRIRFIFPSSSNVPRLPHFAAREVGNSERVRFYSTHYIGWNRHNVLHEKSFNLFWDDLFSKHL